MVVSGSDFLHQSDVVHVAVIEIIHDSAIRAICNFFSVTEGVPDRIRTSTRVHCAFCLGSFAMQVSGMHEVDLAMP